MSTIQLSLHDLASCFLDELLSGYNPEYGLGHMTPSIYDTAWVSMVSKDGAWLFPRAFQYIREHQAPSGGWESYPVCEFDVILNTLACLLSLKLHAVGEELDDAIHKAEYFLSSRLQSWDVETTDRVGFEITVPSMLDALARHGIEFTFPQRPVLLALNTAKLSAIKPENIYTVPTPLLHSLEGLVGHVDFDKLSHHKRNGSFMASPSSTAAYLIHASEWDNDCETYLREAMKHCEAYGAGSVPCAWPTTFFELSWIICALRDGGFEFLSLSTSAVAKIKDILRSAFDESKGIVGFSHGVQPDADDTAKVITALRYLGHAAPAEPLCRAFELVSHFRCYPAERNPSISVQCNVLLALLEVFGSSDHEDGDDMPRLRQTILRTVTFICETFWNVNEDMADKWHTSWLYPLLLIAQSLTKFMLLFNKGSFPECSENIVQTKAPISLFQILIRILQGQADNGSWNSCEETAYAMLALATLSSLPFVSIMIPTIHIALADGRRFLVANSCPKRDTKDAACLWIDKVRYRVPPLSYSYVLAALYITAGELPGYPPTATGELERLIFIPTQTAYSALRFYRKMPMYRDCRDWQLLAYVAEGYLYLPILVDVSKQVWGREGMGKPNYLEAVPFTWTSGNAMTKNYSCPRNVFVCMTISLVNYQTDEFFDALIRDDGQASLPALRKLLDDIFNALNEEKDIRDMDFGERGYPTFTHYLYKYVCWIVYYPTAQRASQYDKAHSWRELKAYLLAMMQQTEDSTRYAEQTSWNTFLHPEMSYMKWVRTLSAEHVSGMTSCCLFVNHLSQDGDVFLTPELKFFAQDAMTHISVLCRIWNDWGSMKRDRAERNVNGMNFPEFAGMTESQAKAAMRRISDYERKLMHYSLEQLRIRAREVMGERKGNAIVDGFELFIRGAESYNAIYEFKDMSAWKLSIARE